MMIYLLVGLCSCSYMERMYPIKSEKTFRLDDSEVTFIANPEIRIDNQYFKTIRVGFNGYIGGTNSQKDYRILPILLMNYDLGSDGGLVHYTEKFNRKYRDDVIDKIFDFFQIRLTNPNILLITWDNMKPKNMSKCYQQQASNDFESILVWQEEKSFIISQYRQVKAPLDCTSHKYGLVST